VSRPFLWETERKQSALSNTEIEDTPLAEISPQIITPERDWAQGTTTIGQSLHFSANCHQSQDYLTGWWWSESPPNSQGVGHQPRYGSHLPMVGVARARVATIWKIAGCRAQWSTSDFSMEQVVELFALACIEPSNYGRAISHWTEREGGWDGQAVHRGEYLPRHVGRLLQEAQLKPHQIRYWLTPRTKNLTPKSVTLPSFTWVCNWASKARERTVCIDEMTGIQALERLAPDLPLRPGKVQRESLSISVMEHKAWLPISMLLQVKSFVRLVAIQELRSILPLSASWLRVNRMPKMGFDYRLPQYASIRIFSPTGSWNRGFRIWPGY